MILFLDTTGDRYCIALVSQTRAFLRTKYIQRNERIGDNVFRSVCLFLKKKHLKGIIVVIGPGRFSGIRHGITLANTLAFAWGIPLIGIENMDHETPQQLLTRALHKKFSSSFLIPRYGKEPTITLSL